MHENSFQKELMRLPKKTRNRIRAMIGMENHDAIKIFNKIRDESGAHEIFHAEKAILACPYFQDSVPELFPQRPVISERYTRVATMDLKKQVEVVLAYAHVEKRRVSGLLQEIAKINGLMLVGDYEGAGEILDEISKEYGYSHILLRKAAVIKCHLQEGVRTADSVIEKFGIANKNIVSTSVINCYNEKTDYLPLKKSILSTRDKGASNRYTRDLIRTTFHPHAFDDIDLANLVQSSMQSSLIDALVICKINKNFFNGRVANSIDEYFKEVDEAFNIDMLARQYLALEDGERTFYQRSSAWIECDQILDYRLLNDFYYDAEESAYLQMSTEIEAAIMRQCCFSSVSGLVRATKITNRKSLALSDLERGGVVARSSLFNLLLKKVEGIDSVDENDLLWLMSHTADLSKTIPIKEGKLFARHLKTRLSQIIIYLLIAKRTRDDLSSFTLRDQLQDEILEKYDGNLVSFVEDIGKKFEPVAIYIHEICTEDFLGKLVRIIRETKKISETRAALHLWRGRKVDSQHYIERARAIEIDYKIGIVRDEIDDHRIYVDASRFIDWLSDNVGQELYAILTSLKHNNGLDEKVQDQQLLQLIERCLAEFYGNCHFGIASYLGRRIRHGTLKGHLYTNVVSIKNNYKALFEDAALNTIWERWRKVYEKTITSEIANRIHINSSTKKDGLLVPNLNDTRKFEIAHACMQDLASSFKQNETTADIHLILVEYCWRLIGVDLSSINAYLKRLKGKLGVTEVIEELRSQPGNQNSIKDFCRDFQSRINDKFKDAQGWFKRPDSVAPKASINLLFKAVVKEVQESFQGFNVNTDFNEGDDLELMGGAYHVIYDAFFVVIYNAAKHGRLGSPLKKEFSVNDSKFDEGGRRLIIKISSEINACQSEGEVRGMLMVDSFDDIDNAQVYENRSGIKKLHHLQKNDERFKVESIECVDRHVNVVLSYRLAH